MPIARLHKRTAAKAIAEIEAAAENVPPENAADAVRRVSAPHPAYVLLSPDDAGAGSLEHVGWQSLVFDGEEAVAIVDLAYLDKSLRWVSTTTGAMPTALAAAMEEAEALGVADEGIDFAVLKVAHLGLSLLWIPENDAFVPVRVPHVGGYMPKRDTALREWEVWEITTRMLKPSPDWK